MTIELLIAGDSWAYTWQIGGAVNLPDQGYGDLLAHSGIAVTNVSRGGASNTESLREIAVALAQRDYTAVIVTQTDPMREDIQDGHLDYSSVYQRACERGSLSAVVQARLQALYQDLTDLSAEYAVPVWVMGGCSKVPVDLLDLGRCEAILPSISEILIPGFQDHVWYDTCCWTTSGYHELVRNHPVLGPEFLRIADMILYKTHCYQSSEYFRPDRWHPNLSAHHKIKDLILARLDGLANK